MADTQSRKWLVTINNPKDKELTHDVIKRLLGSIKDVAYWCMCDEAVSYTHLTLPTT